MGPILISLLFQALLSSSSLCRDVVSFNCQSSPCPSGCICSTVYEVNSCSSGCMGNDGLLGYCAGVSSKVSIGSVCGTCCDEGNEIDCTWSCERNGTCVGCLSSNHFLNTSGPTPTCDLCPDCGVNSFAGSCDTDGACICKPGWVGNRCQFSNEVTCKSHGQVNDATGLCTCDKGYNSSNCGVCANKYIMQNNKCEECIDKETCNDRGTCRLNGTCQCQTAFSGSFCELCATGYGGSKCQCSETTSCSSHGQCLSDDGKCTCNTYYEGANCSQCIQGAWWRASDSTCRPCPGFDTGGLQGVCSGRGVCVGGNCTCNEDSQGLNCEVRLPTIASFTAPVSSLRTQGGDRITMKGATFENFVGIFNSLSFSIVQGSRSQPCLSPQQSVAANTISCVVPAMNSGDAVVVIKTTTNVTNRQQNQVENKITYAGFTINKVVDSAGSPTLPTAGAQVTIFGNNFGVDSSPVLVMVDGVNMPSPQRQDHQRITFNLSAGIGAQHTLTVTIAQPSVSLLFSYRGPQLSSVTPAMIPTTVTTVTLRGAEFGSNPTVNASNTAQWQPCATVVVINATAISCQPAISLGNGPFNIQVAVAGQYATLVGELSYLPPVITAVTSSSGCTTSGSGVINCNSGTVVTITGSNFNHSAPLNVTVTIGGRSCSLDATAAAAGRVQCALPALSVGDQAWQVPVQVCRSDGKCDTRYDLVSYSGITISSVIISNENPMPNTSYTLSVSGNSLLAAAGVKIFFGAVNTTGSPIIIPGLRFNCTVGTIGTSNLICTTAPGVGKNLKVQAQDANGVWSNILDAFTINFIPPTFAYLNISDQTTKLSPYSVVGTTNSNELVSLNGANFGVLKDNVQVTYTNGGHILDCSLQSITNNRIQCLTSKGIGAKYVFTITVGGYVYGQLNVPSNTAQNVTNSSQYFTYPGPPLILSISGCQSKDDVSTWGCNTVGRETINISILVSQFTNSSDFQVQIGSTEAAVCTPKSASLIQCTTPQGVGKVGVVISQGELVSSIYEYLTYASPEITKIDGCVNNICNATNGNIITIGGKNFGHLTPTVRVSGLDCNITSFTAEDTTRVASIIAQLPPQQTLSSTTTLFLFQDGGLYTKYMIQYSNCPAGQYTKLAAKGIICIPCQPGRFSTTVGVSSCRDCLPGKFTNMTGQVQCQLCAVGTYQQDSLTRCVDCGTGTYASTQGQSVCLNCSAGTISAKDGSTQCNKCDKGTYQPFEGRTICIPCETGRFSSSTGLAGCNLCPPGQMQSQESQTVCLTCQAGTYSGEGSASCTNCDVGKFAPIQGLGQCSVCLPGSFVDVTGQVNCKECPVGASQRLTAATGCDMCKQGKFASSVASLDCGDCPKGKFSLEKATICSDCSPGTYASDVSSTTCLQCTQGKFSSYSASSACEDCASGYAAQSGAVNCDICGGGKKSTSDRPSCDLCPIGTFNLFSGQSMCGTCQAGTFADTPGTQQCKSCPTGKFSGASAALCVNCAPGTYNDGSFGKQCQKCDVGKYAGSNGTTTCANCDPGKVTDKTGQTACDNCTAGKYRIGDLTTCRDCSIGRYSNTPGTTQCTACDKGTIANMTGRQQCAQCLISTYRAQEGGVPSECSLCPPGRIGTKNMQTECEQCETGKFQNESGTQTCKPCGLGTYAPQIGLAQCVVCPPGKRALSNASAPIVNDCVDCDKGEYQDKFGQATCVGCQPGFFTADPGQSACFACFAGKFSNIFGVSVCSVCVKGRAQPYTAQQSCAECLAGTYTPQSGLAECLQCPPGRYVNTNHSTNCTFCDTGRASWVSASTECEQCKVGRASGKTGQSECNMCGAGSFANKTGSISCELCPAGTRAGGEQTVTCEACQTGKHQPAQGAAACVECIKGTYADKVRMKECDLCPIGTWQSEVGQAQCKDCDNTTTTLKPGAIFCALCPAGTQRQNASWCVNCQPGKRSKEGTTCETCPPGKFAPSERAVVCSDCTADSISQNNSTVCTSCLKLIGGTGAKPNKGQSLCGCDAGFYLNTSGPAGYDSPTNLECVKCDATWNCAGAPGEDGMLTRCTATLVPGYWRADCALSEIKQCLQPQHCNGDLSKNGGCVGHRQGVKCALCEPGYRMDPRKECLQCDNTNTGYATMIIVVFVMLVFLVGGAVFLASRDMDLLVNLSPGETDSLYSKKTAIAGVKRATRKIDHVEKYGLRSTSSSNINTGLSDPNTNLELSAVSRSNSNISLSDLNSNFSSKFSKFSKNGIPSSLSDTEQDQLLPICRPYLESSYMAIAKARQQGKIIFVFLQCVTGINIASVPWPGGFMRLLSALELTNLSLVPWASTNCAVAMDFFYNVVINVALPAVFLVLYILLELSLGAIYKRLHISKSKIKKVSLFTLFVIYPRVSAMSFQFFDCEKINNEYFLRADYSIRCYEGAWQSWLVPDLILIMCVPIGGLALLTFVIARERANLWKSRRVYYETSFYYSAYRDGYWWFEIADTVHRLTLTALVPLSFPDAKNQFKLGIFVAFTHYMIILMFEPYMKQKNYRLHLLCQTELIMVMLAGLVFLTEGTNGSYGYDALMTVVLVFLVVLVLFIFLWHVRQLLQQFIRQYRMGVLAVPGRAAGTNQPTYDDPDSDDEDTGR